MIFILNVRKAIILLLATILFIGISVDVNAQKRKKNRKAKNDLNQVFSEDDQRLAELYFIEAQKYYILEDYAKAIVLFEKTLELDNQNSAVHYMIAQIYVKNNDPEKALIHAQSAINNESNNKYYYLLLADIYTKQSNFPKVTEVYEEMINKIPGTEEYLFETAAYYIYQENYDKALESYNRIEEKFGVSEQVALQKKNIYIRQGKLDNAIQEIQKLINAYPGVPNYLIQYAEILMTNEKLDEAIEILESGSNKYPDNSKILVYLYESYRKTGRHEEAKIVLYKVFYSTDLPLHERRSIIDRMISQLPNSSIEKDLFDLADATLKAYPEESESFVIYGNLLNRLDSSEAAKTNYRLAVRQDNGNFEAWQNLLELELRDNELDSVIIHSETALEVFPNQAVLFYFNGTAYLMDDNSEKAVKAFEQGKKLSSSNLELRSVFNGQLGDAYNGLKEYEKSDLAYEGALDYNPNSDHVLNNYSYFLSLRKENLDVAIKMSTKLIKRNPDNPTYLDTHAWVLFNRGDYEQAKTYIEKAINLSENASGTLIEHYGDILFKLGEVDGAVRQWQKAKGMDESSDLLDKKIADRKLYE